MCLQCACAHARWPKPVAVAHTAAMVASTVQAWSQWPGFFVIEAVTASVWAAEYAARMLSVARPLVFATRLFNLVDVASFAPVCFCARVACVHARPA